MKSENRESRKNWGLWTRPGFPRGLFQGFPGIILSNSTGERPRDLDWGQLLLRCERERIDIRKAPNGLDQTQNCYWRRRHADVLAGARPNRDHDIIATFRCERVLQ